MDEELAARIGEAARAARREAGLTQADVAESVGMATEVYGRIERGVMLPSVRTLQKIATVLGVSADVMLGIASGKAERAAEARVSGYVTEAPELRRLIRRLKTLDTRRLRLVGLLVHELSRARSR